MQHDHHVSAWIDLILDRIMRELGIGWPLADLSDWYACGDDLI